jgi:hypothetical protein
MQEQLPSAYLSHVIRLNEKVRTAYPTRFLGILTN